MADIRRPCCCPEPLRGSLPDEYVEHIRRGDVEKVQSWLSEGGDVNAATMGGQTLLSLACTHERLDIIQILLREPKIHLNTKHKLGILNGYSPICIAAYKGRTDIVSAFLKATRGECCLDDEATNRDGESALRLAAKNRHWGVVEELCSTIPLPQADANFVASLARHAKNSKIMQILDNQQLKRQSRGSDESVPASERVYENNTSPRGLVLILNYKFEGGEGYRAGTDADADALCRVFKGMDYETEVEHDLNHHDTLEALKKFSKRDRLKEVSCVVVVVLSHGINRNTFLTADKATISMDTLCRHFTDQNCPYMKDKPKIFLLQFCRGSNIASQALRDAVREAMTDMMCLYASQEGFNAFRFEGNPNDPFAGTPFIKAFCHVLETKGHMWLDDIIREFIDEYSNTEYGQPLDSHNLSFKRKFSFNPR